MPYADRQSTTIDFIVENISLVENYRRKTQKSKSRQVTSKNRCWISKCKSRPTLWPMYTWFRQIEKLFQIHNVTLRCHYSFCEMPDTYLSPKTMLSGDGRKIQQKIKKTFSVFRFLKYLLKPIIIFLMFNSSIDFI